MRNLKTTHVCLLLSTLTLGACSSDDDNKQPTPVVNAAPTASDAMLSTQTEVTITDMLSANDNDGDSLTYSLVSEPTLGVVIVNNDGNFTYTPNKEATGSDSFVFGVSDGVNAQVTATVSVTIDALEVDFAQFATDAFNQAPNAEPLSVNGRVFTNTDTDVDGLISTNGN
ncbi:cadherin-like domain-containing protein [Pseudoalteromonas sp. MMG006]|uniref:Ig-like domain-containing protein n=1 Tax=Pseudoalteromonas sp. MMG006 TaxID=2822683 RepID=UPI001B3706D0|nr:Ig-like domain-containing protein [Pseudoalteromonas sp. MMG006]MBQ4799113.1 cadherin-like domain-containing protein [Pseudoalteromonas sp. MMG006]